MQAKLELSLRSFIKIMANSGELDKINEFVLGEIAKLLPTFPPLTDDGDASVADMYPHLTESELTYVYEAYVKLGGTMRKS